MYVPVDTVTFPLDGMMNRNILFRFDNLSETDAATVSFTITVEPVGDPI